MKRMLVFAACCLLFTSVAAAETVSKSFDPDLTRARWTPEAFASARALPLPRVEFRAERAGPVLEKAAPGEDDFVELFPSLADDPTLSDEEAARFGRKLFDFTPEELARLRGTDEQPEPVSLAEKNYGSGGLDYTSSRLIPSSAVEEFPYRAVGKLFFSDGTDTFVCSASIITKRLAITAAHCVHDGPGRGFFEDFTFVPAYLDGNAPFGSWAVTEAFVTSGWADVGEIPHPEDYALLEIEDQGGDRIADVTGKLAFLADSLADNHLHLLGYPTNHDGGEQMHQITSGDWFNFGDGTVAYGSDMSGGSSGGPWIQNFNRKAAVQGGGRQRARLVVVGVTSYGFVDDAIRAQAASILTRTFKVLRQDACRNQAGNC